MGVLNQTTTNNILIMVFLLVPVAGTTQALTIGTLGSATATTTAAGTALALSGGLVVLKVLALGALAAARSKREAEAEANDTSDSAFALLAQQEPAQCYRRLICDLATGAFPASENDVIVEQFSDDEPIESFKFEFASAAKLGKSLRSVEKCELRYSCPLSGAQIQKLF